MSTINDIDLTELLDAINELEIERKAVDEAQKDFQIAQKHAENNEDLLNTLSDVLKTHYEAKKP